MLLLVGLYPGLLPRYTTFEVEPPFPAFVPSATTFVPVFPPRTPVPNPILLDADTKTAGIE